MDGIVTLQLADPAAIIAKLDEVSAKLDRLLSEREKPAAECGDPYNMTTKEAAAYLRVSQGLLNRSRIATANACEGPPFHNIGSKGSKVYYVKAELDEWRDTTRKSSGRTMTKMERRLKGLRANI
ncbi:MAG: hypothetical protein RRY12_01430 [Cloacibacillus sp.]